MYISIRNRLIFLLIAFALLPFIILRIVAYPKVQSDVENIIIRNLDGVGHKQAELVSNWMHERMENARVLANNPAIVTAINMSKNDKDYNKIVTYLEGVKKEYGLQGVIITNRKGQITLATKGEALGADVSEKQYYKQAIEGRTFVSDVFRSNISLKNELGEKEIGLPTMLVSAPIQNEAKLSLGIIALRVDVNTLRDLMLSLRLGQTGESYLVNKDGYMITESRFADHLKEMGIIKERCALELKVVNPETEELTRGVSQCISGNDGYDAAGYTDYAGVKVLGAWRWLPEFNWGVVTEIDKDEGYGVAYNLKNIVSAVLLVIAFPMVIAAYLLGRQITNPILHLHNVTEKMASGDFSQRLDIKREDEIGKLAGAFNSMVESLDDKTREIVDSEKRYRGLFNSIKEGVYECEPHIEGVFTFVNQAGAEILGYNSPEEVVGTKVADIYVNSEDRTKLVEKLEKDGIWKGFVSFCKRKNGECFYMERTSNMVRDENGEPSLIYGVFRDITERKKLEDELQESEKHHRSLLNSLREGIYQCEPSKDGVFTWVNQAAAELLGYNSPEEVVGTRVDDIYVNPDDRKELIGKLEKEGVWREFTAYCKKKNGERFISETTCNLVRDETGTPIRIEGVFRDITER